MKIVMISNFINHHQVAVADALHATPGVSYLFIETMDTPAEQKNLGYPDLSDRPYLIKAYKSAKEYGRACDAVSEADVVIEGGWYPDLTERRIMSGKLTFRYCESIFKRGRWRILDPRVLRNLYREYFRFRNKNLHVLAASAFLAGDLKMIGFPQHKIFKWGYFPLAPKVDERTQKSPDSIMWCGRFLKWKHPELTIDALSALLKEGYSINLDLYGTGEIEERMKDRVAAAGLSDHIRFHGAVSNGSVVKEMNRHRIFLFTSDRNEGWGAVLNESMGCGCAVVASDRIGSVPFLVRNGENGLIFRCGDAKSLAAEIRRLLDDRNLAETLGDNARRTIHGEWSPENAAKRFLALCDTLLHKPDDERRFPLSGPCSLANPKL